MMNKITRFRWVDILLLCCFLVFMIGRAFGGGSLPSRKSDPEIQRQQGELIRAIWLHDLKTFQNLLEQGLNPDFLFPDGNVSPLSEAIAEHQPKMIALLLDHGADVNFGAERGLVALSVAAWYDDSDTITELLKRGAKIETRDNEGYTALLKAASQAQGLKVIKLLIESGADMRARTSSHGDSALMLAAYRLNADAVRFFVQAGLDPCVHNNDGETAIDYANVQVLQPDAEAKLKARK